MSTRVIVAVPVLVVVVVKGRLRLAGIVASAPPKVVKPKAARAISRRLVVHTISLLSGVMGKPAVPPLFVVCDFAPVTGHGIT